MNKTIEQAKQALKKITKGPWYARPASDGLGVRNSGGFLCFLRRPSRYAGQEKRFEKEIARYEANADFIAQSPQLIKDLLTLCEEQGEELEAWKTKHNDLQDIRFDLENTVEYRDKEIKNLKEKVSIEKANCHELRLQDIENAGKIAKITCAKLDAESELSEQAKEIDSEACFYDTEYEKWVGLRSATEKKEEKP